MDSYELQSTSSNIGGLSEQEATTPTSASCDFSNQTEPPVCVDKSINCVPKMVSVRSQYRLDDIVTEEVSSTPRSLLKVKIQKKTQKSRAVNTEISFSPSSFVEFSIREDSEYDTEESEIENKDLRDSSFNVDTESSETDDYEDGANITISSDISPISDSKFIVFWGCLLPLLRFCFICNKPATISSCVNKGTMIIVTLLCNARHTSVWRSQPSVNGMAAGNLLLAASILYTGNTYTRVCELMATAKINFFSHTLFHRIQSQFLFPAVASIFSTYQQSIVAKRLLANPLNVIGDGRCDSPGYNAKYCTYTVMDASTQEIIDFNVTHVATAGNSSRMEKLGLVNIIDSLQKMGLTIDSLTTDRHVQIKSYMSKEQIDIKHQFDVWHVTKNIKKKIVKKAQKKDTRELNDWVKSVVNHFWWCCATCHGNPKELREKWLSILCHVRDKHRWEGNEIFKKCAHEKLSKVERIERKFLEEGSPAYLALESVVTDKYLLSDLKYMTNFSHTGQLEVYHSLYTKYCPKRLHFSYPGMQARAQIAVLDYNSGVDSGHATTKSNDKRYKQVFSKVTQSWVVKPIANQKDRSIYLTDMLNETIRLKESKHSNEVVSTLPDVPMNIAPVPKPDKREAIKSIRTRFSVEN